MDLIYFLKILYRKKWVIIGLSFLAVVVAFVLLLNKEPQFVSIAQYSTGFTAEKVRVIDGSSGIDIYTADVKFNNAIETFKSPQVISTISYKLLSHDLENPQKAYRKLSPKDLQSPVYKDINLDTAKRILREKILTNGLLRSDNRTEKVLIEFLKLYGYDYDGLNNSMTIERVARTDYLNIIFRSENPELSAVVVNAMGQEFLNYYKNLSSQRTEENAEEIKKLVAQQQSKVDSIGKSLYIEKVKQGSIDPVSLSTSAMETVKELETKLAEEKSKQNEHFNRKAYLTERLKSLQGTLSGSGGSNDEIVRLTNKKNDLVAQIARQGGNDAALQKQLDDVRAELMAKSNRGSSSKTKAKEIDDLTMQINEENALLNAANSTIADYTSRIRKYTGMAQSAPVGSDVTIEGIKNQLDIENKQLGNVMEKYTQAEGLVRDDPTTNFIQTRIGQPAIDPESKKTMITMMLSGVSMFFLTSIIFLFLEIFDPAVKTPSTFRKLVKLPIVNLVNMVPLRKRTAFDIVLDTSQGKKYIDQNVFKNNIRKLRYEVLDSQRKVILFTSSQTKSGKTAVIEALAAGLLLSKKKVLVMDLNFSHNSLTQQYNPGVFIEDIASRINYAIPASAQKLTSPTTQPGLDIIGCKQANLTPFEATPNLDFDGLLALLKNEYDYILIEAAALNHYADGRELSAYADAVYTVFSATSVLTQSDRDSFKFIASLGEKNQGVIFNKVLTEHLNY
jgi:polysaccharide biosynthesis transport protein